MTAIPRVTVILPVRNGGAFLRGAIESVLAQTFRDFELLVIDDGSTDESGNVAESFADPRIRVVRNDRNLGLTPTLNLGLRLARTELIARQDADDVWERERLARQVAHLDANPEVVVVGSWYRKIDDAGNVLGDRHLPLDDAHLRWALLHFCPVIHSAALFRRDAVLALGGYDERFVYAQDYDLWSRLARGHRLATVPEYLVRYRVGATSMTATFGERSAEGLAIAHENASNLLQPLGANVPTVHEHADVYTVLYGAAPLTIESTAAARAFANASALLDAFRAHPMVAAGDADPIAAEALVTMRRRFMESMDRFTEADFERVGVLLFGRARWPRLLRARRIRSALVAARRSPLGDLLARRTRRS